MIQLEDQRNAMMRKQNAINTRREIEEFNKESIRRKAEEVKKELEMDHKIISEIKKEMDNEVEEQNKRKREIKREMDLFMDHINRQRLIEKERQKQIDDAYLQEYNKVGTVFIIIKHYIFILIIDICMSIKINLLKYYYY